jgi:hypothetical protein
LRGPVFVLFLVALFNLFVRKLGPKFGLTASELLVIYSMIAISTCITGFGEQQFLVNMIPAGSYYASAANHYDRFLHLVPGYLTVNDKRAAHEFYLGHSNFLRSYVVKAWALPVLVWSGFLITLTTVTLCLASLFSREWIRSERLNFPLVELPVKMAEGASSGIGGLFRSRAMWAGFCAAGLLESIDYLNYFYPTLPYIQIKPYHLEQFITIPPWNSIGTFTSAFYPFAIGISYLLSLDVSFSCWFFYLATKAENILTGALGLSDGMAHGAYATPPYLYEQGVGAFLALGLFLIYRVRKSVFPYLRKSTDASGEDNGQGLMSQRAAMTIVVVGFAILAAFITIIGVPPILSIAFLLIYLLFVIVLTRIVAEAGAGWAWAPGVPVHGVILDATGINGVTPNALTAFGMLSWFDGELRDICMPHQLEAMKMRDEMKSSRSQMLWGLLVAAVLSCFAGFGTYMQIYYHFGAVSAHVRPALAGIGMNELRTVDQWLRSPRSVDRGALQAMFAGAAVVTVLSGLRRKLIWWPFHPIGYVLAGTPSMEYMWMPFLIGWGIKTITLRYGGVKMYRQFLPFFLGLILGDYVVPTLWGLWGMITGAQVYMAFPH